MARTKQTARANIAGSAYQINLPTRPCPMPTQRQKRTRRSPSPPPSPSPPRSPSPPPQNPFGVISETRTLSLDYSSGLKVLKVWSLISWTSNIKQQSSFPRRNNPPDPNDNLVFSRFSRTVTISNDCCYVEHWTKAYDNNGNVTHEKRVAINHHANGDCVFRSDFETFDQREIDEWRDEWQEETVVSN